MVDYSQVMQTAIVALCLAAGPGLQAGKIPLQNDQPATKKEGVDAFELRLQFKEKLAHCVDIDMHVDYCLVASRPERVFSRGKKIKFYLNNKLVYNCSSSGVCTAHGALKENTRIKVASEGCKGIPFANINKDLIGEYVAVAEDPPERFKASFNLTFCNREKSLELSLELRGEAANCVSQSHRDGYCLSVWMDGQPIKNKAFKCYLERHLVYNCSTERVCTGHGILRDNIRPKYVARDCYGIPFANVVPQAAGKYSCVVEDDTFLIEASYDLVFCSEINNADLILMKSGVEVTCIDNQSVNIDEYCLSVVSDKTQLYEEYNITVDGTPRYSCNSSHTCSGDGNNGKGVSGSCSGIKFTGVDDRILGNYSFTAKTQYGSIVTGSYALKYCQGSQMEMTVSFWITGVIIITVALSAVLLFIMGIICIHRKRPIKEWFCSIRQQDNVKRDDKYLKVNTCCTERTSAENTYEKGQQTPKGNQHAQREVIRKGDEYGTICECGVPTENKTDKNFIEDTSV